MAKAKRKSGAMELAMKRLSGLEAISPELNLGNELTVAKYSAAIDEVISNLDVYNTLLSNADSALNNLTAKEKNLRELSERMLEAVGAIYGHDGNEYEKAGGKRKSERKRPERRKKAA